MRRSVAVLAMMALFLAGFAQAAHFHRNDPVRGNETHPQCLLCLHADRWAGPAELPRLSARILTGGTMVVVAAAVSPTPLCLHGYDARGPPRV
jgi:hypothetical protein